MLLLSLLLESHGICREAGRKASPHNFEHAPWAQQTALGSVLSSWSWSIAVSEESWLTPSEELKSEVQDRPFLLFLFIPEKYTSLHIYMSVLACAKGGRGRGENAVYPI